jgi:hypothetical protein
MKLSANFTLEEFLISQTAERHGIDMTPPPEVVGNLRRLCEGCLQPLRAATNRPIFISSGFRSPELNSLIGGSQTSAHMRGDAADFRVSGMTPFDTCKLIVEMGLPYDQVIHEFGRWVHLGVSDILRSEQLTAYHKDGKTRYVHGIKTMEECNG